jgi:cytochrome c
MSNAKASRNIKVIPFLKTASRASLMLAMIGCGIASAADYPGCSALKDADFRMVTVVNRQAGSLDQPIKMGFDMSDAGDVDIYFVEIPGTVKKYDAATKTVVNLGKIAVHTVDEYGLMGIAMDPNFKANKFIYVLYMSPNTPYELRISRFTIASNKLDLASEKIMIHMTAETGWHGGGGMAFDAAGNLWVGIGDTRSGEVAAPNTNDLRGKILRIHPQADGSYTIPAGNLFPEGTAKTKPEIYIMGNREPYTLAIDPKTQWLVWGEVGPDGYGQTEEYDVATKPYNAGFPYFAGNNKLLTQGDGIHTTPGTEKPAAPTNTSAANTGLATLPPAIPATYAYQQSCGMTGPVYRYNYIPNSPIKMPPQFDGLWFVTDFLSSNMDTMALDANGVPKQFGKVFSLKLNRPTDFKVGPDGAFYAVNYSGNYNTNDQTSIVRIEYTGTCRPAVDNSTRIADGGRKELRPEIMRIRNSRVTVTLEGEFDLKVRDLAGRLVLAGKIRGGEEFDLASLTGSRAGLYEVNLASPMRNLFASALVLSP